MEVRRALILFAIVLGFAAVVTVLADPVREESPSSAQDAPSGTPSVQDTAPSASPRAAATTRTLRFTAGRGPDLTRTIESGQAATLVISAPSDGQVDIPELGLSATVEPRTPATFSVLGDQPGRFTVSFTAVGGGPETPIGVLRVTSGDAG